MDKLLDQIDAIKRSITDQQYRDIMDSMKEIHDKTSKLDDRDCDCCGLSWGDSGLFICHCWCSRCDDRLRECRYTCQ